MGIEDPIQDDSVMIKPLRFAIIGSGAGLEAWQARCLEQLRTPGGAQLVLRMVLASPDSSPSVSSTDPENGSFSWFPRYRRFCLRPDAQRTVPAASVFDHVPVRVCRITMSGENIVHFHDTDISAIAQYDLDFMVHFGDSGVGGKILEAARFGVWAFDYGDREETLAGPPAFWEIFRGNPATGGTLRRLTGAESAGVVLKQGFLKTIHYSYSRNLSTLLFECALWPAQVCTDILNDNADYLEAPPVRHKAPGYSLPSNRQMILFFAKILRNLLAEMRNTFFRHGLWNIGIVHAPIHVFLEPRVHHHVEYLHSAPADRFLADPFGIVRDGRLNILCEGFDYHTYRGIISSIEFDATSGAEKMPVQPQTALDLPAHASYPYLFEHQGEVYCVPETARMREVSLYRALEFPKRWVKVAVLLPDVAGVDATLFQYDGLWWLTCTDKNQWAQAKLFIWYAPDLYGPWQPHAANPVKTDVRSARPAGTPFLYQGRLYRPAQDCSRTYGGAIIIHEVTHLSTRKFSEKPVAVVNPDPAGPYPDGTHTLSAVGHVTLVDGKRFAFKGRAFRHALRRELAKIGFFRRRFGDH